MPAHDAPPAPVGARVDAPADGATGRTSRAASAAGTSDAPAPDAPAPDAPAPDAPDLPHTPGGWPCSACGTGNAVELDACTRCGLGFLAGLRAGEPPLLELPGVGDITALGRAQRLGLAGAAVLLVVLLTAMLGLLAG